MESENKYELLKRDFDVIKQKYHVSIASLQETEQKLENISYYESHVNDLMEKLKNLMKEN